MTLKQYTIRLALLILGTIPLLFITGCYGARETDEMGFVTVLGIDKAGDKDKITYQIAISPKKGSTTPSEEDPWIISSFTTPSLAETRMLLNTTIPRPPNLSHITTLIISEEKARDGLNPILANFMRNRNYRENIFFIVVEGSAEDYIKQNKPVLEEQIHKFYETTFSSSNMGYFLKVQLHDLYIRLKTAGGSAYAVYSGINPKNGENKPQGGETPEQKGEPYLPGGIPRKGTATAVDFVGLAVFHGDKLIGVLDSDETRAAAILQNKFYNGYIGVVDPLAPEKDVININIFMTEKPTITADLSGDKPTFHIDVKLEGELLGVTSYINYEAPKYRELLENQTANLMKGQIMKMLKHTQTLGTDPAGLGLYLRPKFSNTAKLQDANLTALYEAAQFEVNVSVKIRRTGLLRQSSPKSQGGTL
ncbi:MAG: Ger(x)C family spore germination protein [Pelosinus sp.]|nr:Ger(x)C family spore germination protein [Pelosinus sp.]